MKKGDTKSDEIFFRLTLKEDFQKEVAECRTVFGIPNKGFPPDEEAKNWHRHLPFDVYGAFLRRLEAILESRNLSQTFQNILEEYVLTNGTKILYPERPYPLCDFDNSGIRATELRKKKVPFVSLLIYDNASLPEVQKHLKDTWEYVGNSLEEQRGRPAQRIRNSSHKERDREILELYEKSRVELGLNKKDLKEVRVATLISDKYGHIEPEHVKKIVARMRRLRQEDT